MTKCGSIPKHRSGRLAENMSIEISPCSQSIIGLCPENIEAIALTAIDEHHRQIQGWSKNVRKNAPETSVSIVSMENCPVLCVKHFKYRGAVHAAKCLFRSTHGLRAFRSGTYLFNHGFTAAASLALIRNSRFMITIEEWLVMVAVPDSKELDRYLVHSIRQGLSEKQKNRFIDEFAKFLADLHQSGVFHTDLKTCNIMVSTKGESQGLINFSLLDYDDVKIRPGGIALWMRAKNLSQLYLSTPAAINLDDRKRFIKLYLKFCANISIDKNRLIRMLLTKIKGKSLLYVGPEGDISENSLAANELDKCYETFAGT